MAKSFTDPIAFKTSLEARLRTLAAQRGIALNTLRLKLVIERLLARLFAQPHPPWLLKGGYAMELRYRPRARTTRDIDLGFGDETGGTPETLAGDDLLAFAGIRPAMVLAISTPQQFAEKLHAYTHLWTDRVNTRTKDLVDMVLLIEMHSIQPADVAIAVERTFFRRNTHPIPLELPDPPLLWDENFASLAAEAQLQAATLSTAIKVLRNFWLQVQAVER